MDSRTGKFNTDLSNIINELIGKNKDEGIITRDADTLLKTEKGRNEFINIFSTIYNVTNDEVEDVIKIYRPIPHSVMGDNHLCSITDSIDSSLKEIQSIRHLTDIMERNIKGELTEQDKIDLKENAQEWSQDIEALMQMIGQISE